MSVKPAAANGSSTTQSSTNVVDGVNGGSNGRNGANGNRNSRGKNSHQRDTSFQSEKVDTEATFHEESWSLPPHLGGGDQETKSPRRFPRISLPVEMMRDSYDVVVIGTGYGGGVAASRMARGQQKVCVLERGKERWPGEFPEMLPDAAKEIRLTGEFAPGDRRSVPGTLVDGGNPTGLYHFAVGEGQNVYMANGLGGTSLVNANVFLEATPAVLDMNIWPKDMRGIDNWRKCEYL